MSAITCMIRDTHYLLADAVKLKHETLDQHYLLRKLVSEKLILREYLQVLQMMRSCFYLLEPGLADYERLYLKPDTSAYIPKCAAFDHDLQQLGESPAPVTGGIIPACIDNPGAYLGARYVLEGSAQGGVFIANCLERSLPELCNRAFRFWALQRHSSQHWSAFLVLLSQLDGDNTGQAQAIQAASHSFDLFLSIFSSVSHV